jgi:hypothetical protein
MDNADEVAREVVKAIVEQSKTIGDFATQLGKLIIFLDPSFKSDFVNKLRKGYYKPRALINLSPEEKAQALENMKRLDPNNPNVLG